jgi:hypothetical protein
MSKYIGWETATSLLLAYDTLAANHTKTLRHAPTEPGKDEPHPYYKYKNAFALLILNASIVEGTMRTILSERVKADLDKAVARGSREGRTEHDPPTRLLENFLIELESNGSWSKLLTSAASYLGYKMDREIDAPTRDGIDHLMNLRNVFAHGTALIQPFTKMSDDMKGQYPFNWQSKLHGIAMYLEKQFCRGDIFLNLAHPDCPKHFMEVTERYLTEIEKHFSPLPERAANTIEMVKAYRFGYANWDR